MKAPLDVEQRMELQQQLLELDGVLHAGLDPDARHLWIVHDSRFERGPVELAVRNRLSAAGLDPADLDVHVTVPTDPGPRRRVRFEHVERAEEGGRTTITVALEWDDRVVEGSATGEKGGAIELKTTARAALDALENLTGEDLQVRVIGAKPVHVFDSDLMVTSLYRGGENPQRLVGSVVVADDLLSAAAVAVLSALNRTLGNFLHTSD